MFYEYVKTLVEKSREISKKNIPFTGNAAAFRNLIPNEYKGMPVRASFGQGNWASVTWIGFLCEGQTIQNGIYPVYLYYREKDTLILAYGVSDTNIPTFNWPLENLTKISDYFGTRAVRYKDSYVYKSYDSKALKNIDATFDKDLDNLIKIYKDIMKDSSIPISNSIIDCTKTYQKIFFGNPGTGKSRAVNDFIEKMDGVCFRTTFHPDYDYSSFVGAYKPTKGTPITYKFVPQIFTEAYIYAWSNPDVQTFLVIEEINRGNCAQIFGDLFQLLDRNANGVSEYHIQADVDLYDYLISEDGLGEDHEGIKDGELCLPANLHILATMNTSDQSLFPMDSAFKRRWEWEYVPIKTDESVPSKNFVIDIDGEQYSWHEFLYAVNKKIAKVSESEDKQMGNFFIKHSIDKEEFKSKVMFYLWSEICKDEYKHNSFFKYIEDGVEKEFSFNDLYKDGGDSILPLFIEQAIDSEKQEG